MSTKSVMARVGLVPATIIGLQSVSVGARAQEAAPQEQQAAALEEVIVTARYRQESAQSTPLAITAVSGDSIEARGVNELASVVTDAPNIVFTQNQGSSAVAAFIRGVGQSDGTFFLEPGVGTYVDDVYLGASIGSNLQLMDIDRMEVLRGPQGTLFGKNSAGGAIRIYTRQPTGSGEGYVEAGYGSYNTSRLRGAFDTAIIPGSLFLRVSGASLNSDGYIDTIDFPCANPGLAGSLPTRAIDLDRNGCKLGSEGGQDIRSGRVALRWLPTSSIDATLSLDYTDQNNEPVPEVLLAVNDTFNAGINATVFVPTFGIPLDSRFIHSDPYKSYDNFINSVNGVAIPRKNDLSVWGSSLNVKWTGPQGLTVKSITAYREFDGENGRSSSGPLTVTANYETFSQHQFSQEINVSGAALGEKLEWTVGGFYYSDAVKHVGNIDIFSAQLAPGVGLQAGIDSPAEREDLSGFLHGIFRITDKLSFEGGYRYSTEDAHFANSTVIINLGNTPLVPPTSSDVDYTRSDYKALLGYQWTDDLLTYVSMASGFKAGGVNPRPTTPAQLVGFKPEKLIAYEVGLKSSWFDRRLRLNAAVFMSDYKDLQQLAQTTDNSGLPAFLTTNTGEYKIYGQELELTALPVDGLQLALAIGHLDFKTESLGAAAGIVGGPCEDCDLTYAPDWTGSASASYRWELGAAGSLMPRVEYKYQGETFFDPPNTPIATERGYGVVNAQLQWRDGEEQWSLTLSGSNLTDELYYTTMINSLDNAGYLSAQPGMPRTYMVSVRRDF